MELIIIGILILLWAMGFSWKVLLGMFFLCVGIVVFLEG